MRLLGTIAAALALAVSSTACTSAREQAYEPVFLRPGPPPAPQPVVVMPYSNPPPKMVGLNLFNETEPQDGATIVSLTVRLENHGYPVQLYPEGNPRVVE